jgi:hypothetical protein
MTVLTFRRDALGDAQVALDEMRFIGQTEQRTRRICSERVMNGCNEMPPPSSVRSSSFLRVKWEKFERCLLPRCKDVART